MAVCSGWLLAQFVRENRGVRLEKLSRFNRILFAPLLAADRKFDRWFSDKKANRAHREYGYITRGLSHDNLWDKVRLWLKELERITRHEIDRHSDGKPTYASLYDPDDPETKWLHGEVFMVRPRGSTTKMWLRLAAAKSSRGYRPVEVIQEPPPTHAAIVAALTILEIGEEATQELREALPKMGEMLDDLVKIRDTLENQSERSEGLPESADSPHAGTKEEREDLKSRAEIAEGRIKFDLARHRGQGIEYLMGLLRFYRPDFDARSHKERHALVGRALNYTNALLSAQRNLLRFLEYGEPDKDLRVPVAKAARDVQAAVLADVEKLSPTAIGEVLEIPPSKSDAVKGGHSTVSKMIGRGREILVEAWGSEGWKERAETLADEADDDKATTNEPDTAGYHDALRRLRRLNKEGPAETEAARLVNWAAFFPETFPEDEEGKKPKAPPDSRKQA